MLATLQFVELLFVSNNLVVIEKVLLFLLTFSVVIGVPSYIFFREKMVKKPQNLRVHSRRRVVLLTAVNLALNLLVATFFSTFLLLILNRANFLFDQRLIALVLGYLLAMGLTFYGNGIYITSVVLENFTLPELRSLKAFKTQFIVTHLFHGPISHILIYSGWILVLLILSILDLHLPLSTPESQWLILLIAGGILGAFFSIGQIYNGTAFYQFLTGTISAYVTAYLLLVKQVSLSVVPITSYFVGFLISFELVIATYLIYLLILKLNGGHVIWGSSGKLHKVDSDEK